MKSSQLLAAVLILLAGMAAGYGLGRKCSTPETGQYQFFTTPGAVLRGNTTTGELWRFDSKAGEWLPVESDAAR